MVEQSVIEIVDLNNMTNIINSLAPTNPLFKGVE